MTARQHPLILTAPCLRMSKLKDAGPTVAVRIKMCGTKEEVATAMVNPFHAQQGGSFNLGKALKKTGKAVAKVLKERRPRRLGSLRNQRPGLQGRPHCKGLAIGVARYVSAASGAAILAETVTGQPEVVALGAAGKAASKLAGAGGEKQPMKPARCRLSQDPTQI